MPSKIILRKDGISYPEVIGYCANDPDYTFKAMLDAGYCIIRYKKILNPLDLNKPQSKRLSVGYEIDEISYDDLAKLGILSVTTIDKIMEHLPLITISLWYQDLYEITGILNYSPSLAEMIKNYVPENTHVRLGVQNAISDINDVTQIIKEYTKNFVEKNTKALSEKES